MCALAPSLCGLFVPSAPDMKFLPPFGNFFPTLVLWIYGPPDWEPVPKIGLLFAQEIAARRMIVSSAWFLRQGQRAEACAKG